VDSRSDRFSGVTTKIGSGPRTCVRCGSSLSRYNPADLCTACAGAHAVVTRSLDESPGLDHSRSRSRTPDSAGQFLRAWRVASRLSQASVAAALGMTQQHLSQIETGRERLSLEQRRRIIRQLGIAPEDLGLATESNRVVVDEDTRDPQVAASRFIWRSQRRWLNHHRSELAGVAAKLYPQETRVPRSTLIAPPEWQLDQPIELDSIRLELDESPQTVEVDGTEPESEPMRPLRTTGVRYDRYTSAIRHLDPPHLFESRPSYRLLGGSPRAGILRFGIGAYFDKLDISEALGHELAAASMDLGDVPNAHSEVADRLAFRNLIGDPFDARRRSMIPAVTTLTIRLRRYPAEPSFLLHWRDPVKVATAAGVYDVVPAGEFQPSSVALWDRRSDFDLWRNIVREYSEELLGTPEHDSTRTQPIDYDGWPLYQELQQARNDGRAHVAILGMGLDSLTLAATILTVVVLDDDVFCRSFGSAVRFNDEGEIVAVAGGVPMDGVPFTASSMSRMLENEPMASPGAACLSLAWQHRSQLLGL
jgi:transcriptional regulator with XRE-family HTH domain